MRNVKRRNVGRWMGVLAVGASLLGPFAGCRESVTIAFYNGLENLAIGLVQAFFDAITPTSSETTTTAAALAESLQHWLA